MQCLGYLLSYGVTGHVGDEVQYSLREESYPISGATSVIEKTEVCHPNLMSVTNKQNKQTFPLLAVVVTKSEEEQVGSRW